MPDTTPTSRLIALLSHEMGSSLGIARIQFRSVLQDGGVASEQLDRFKDALEELDHLEAARQALKEPAEVEAMLAMCRPHRVDLGGALRRIVAEYRDANPAADYRLSTGEQPMDVLGEDDLLGLMIRKLLDNGTDFGAEHGPIRISMERVGLTSNGDARLRISIENGGGLALEKDAIFEDFVSAGPALGKLSGPKHYGFGLGIARTIARAFGGDLLAEVDEEPPVVRMVIELPEAKAS